MKHTTTSRPAIAPAISVANAFGQSMPFGTPGLDQRFARDRGFDRSGRCGHRIDRLHPLRSSYMSADAWSIEMLVQLPKLPLGATSEVVLSLRKWLAARQLVAAILDGSQKVDDHKRVMKKLRASQLIRDGAGQGGSTIVQQLPMHMPWVQMLMRYASDKGMMAAWNMPYADMERIFQVGMVQELANEILEAEQELYRLPLTHGAAVVLDGASPSRDADQQVVQRGRAWSATYEADLSRLTQNGGEVYFCRYEVQPGQQWGQFIGLPKIHNFQEGRTGPTGHTVVQPAATLATIFSFSSKLRSFLLRPDVQQAAPQLAPWFAVARLKDREESSAYLLLQNMLALPEGEEFLQDIEDQHSELMEPAATVTITEPEDVAEPEAATQVVVAEVEEQTPAGEVEVEEQTPVVEEKVEAETEEQTPAGEVEVTEKPEQAPAEEATASEATAPVVDDVVMHPITLDDMTAQATPVASQAAPAATAADTELLQRIAQQTETRDFAEFRYGKASMANAKAAESDAPHPHTEEELQALLTAWETAEERLEELQKQLAGTSTAVNA